MKLNEYPEPNYENQYLEGANAFHKLCREIIISLCKHCPHKFDSHPHHCMKACPIEQAVEDKGWKLFNSPANALLSERKG